MGNVAAPGRIQDVLLVVGRFLLFTRKSPHPKSPHPKILKGIFDLSQGRGDTAGALSQMEKFYSEVRLALITSPLGEVEKRVLELPLYSDSWDAFFG